MGHRENLREQQRDAGRIPRRPSFALGLLVLALAPATPAASSTCYDALSLGGFHGLALARNTTVVWGQATAGQGEVPPALASSSSISLIAAGGFHSCAAYGGVPATSVTCWGGGVTPALTPPTTLPSPIYALSASAYASCAVAGSSRQLYCWGPDTYGLVSPLPIQTTLDVRSVSLGAYHGCAVFAASQVVCWGRNDAGQVSGLPSFLASGNGGPGTQVACGGFHCCAWGMVGSLSITCWGASAAGQLVVPSALSPPPSAVTSVCGGGHFSCAVTGGSVTCWGSGAQGATAVPAGARDGNVTGLACGWYGACATKAEGGLVCWGEPYGTSGLGMSSGNAPAVASFATADALDGSPSGSVVVSSGASSAAAPADTGAVSVLSGSVTDPASIASSGAVAITSGSVATGASGAVSLFTGAAAGDGSTGPVVIGTGSAATDAARGSISLLAPRTYVGGSFSTASLTASSLSVATVTSSGPFTLGGTALTEADLLRLLALLVTPSPTPTSSTTPSTTPSATPSASTTASTSPTTSPTTSVSISVGSSVTTTPSMTPTASGSGTVTPSFTSSPSISPSFTPSTSITPSFTASITGSRSVTPSQTRTRSASPSGTASLTPVAPGTGIYVTTMRVTTATGSSQTFSNPTDTAFGPGGVVFVAEANGNRIWSISSTSTVATLLAGSVTGASGGADGIGPAATFSGPKGLCYDAARDVLYVTEIGGAERLRAINLTTNAVSTLAGSASAGDVLAVGTAARFKNPLDILLHPAGDRLYISDNGNGKVKALNLATLAVTLLFNFNTPSATSRMSIDPLRGFLYVEAGTGSIAKLRYDATPPTADFVFISGLSSVRGMTLSPDNSTLWVADTVNNCLREYNLPNLTASRTVGKCGPGGYSDGPAAVALFRNQVGINFSPYNPRLMTACDPGNNVLRLVIFP